MDKVKEVLPVVGGLVLTLVWVSVGAYFDSMHSAIIGAPLIFGCSVLILVMVFPFCSSYPNEHERRQ